MNNKLRVIILAVCSGAALHPQLNHAAVLGSAVTNETNCHDYYFLTANTWAASEAEAISLGGHLVTIDDEAEQSWLISTFATYGYIERSLWIGLSDSAIEGTFMWADGTPLNYTNWAPGWPDYLPDHSWFPPDDFAFMIKSGTGLPGGTWMDSDSDNLLYSGFGPINGVVEVVPEPSTAALTATAPLIIAAFRRRGICRPW